MKKVLYIAGLGHSGSTLLDALLSYHPNVIGCGEVFSLYTNKEGIKVNENTGLECSCGQSYKKCPLWSQNSSWDREAYASFYRDLLNKISKLSSGDKGFELVVDSSKGNMSKDGQLLPLAHLKSLHDKGEIELYVVLLVKDVRARVASYIASLDRNKNRVRKYVPLPYRLVRWYLGWYNDNRKFLNFLKKEEYKFRLLTYEELCLNTQVSMENLFNFVGLNPEDWSMNNKGNTHIAYGNRMKLSLGETLRIKYDNSWFYNGWVNFFYMLLPHITAWNKKVHNDDYDKRIN